jgi:hypothetical protein
VLATPIAEQSAAVRSQEELPASVLGAWWLPQHSCAMTASTSSQVGVGRHAVRTGGASLRQVRAWSNKMLLQSPIELLRPQDLVLQRKEMKQRCRAMMGRPSDEAKLPAVL